jgi:hypothetical protein
LQDADVRFVSPVSLLAKSKRDAIVAFGIVLLRLATTSSVNWIFSSGKYVAPESDEVVIVVAAGVIEADAVVSCALAWRKTDGRSMAPKTIGKALESDISKRLGDK